MVPETDPVADGAGGSGASGRLPILEARLRAAEEQNARLRQVLDSAVGYAIITTDADGVVTGWNKGAEAITGHGEAEMLGRSGALLFTEEDRAEGAFALELCRALEHGAAVNERWHLARDAGRFWASGLMMPLGTGGFLNIFRNRTEEQARVAAREALVAEMSHRLKNTYALVQAIAAQTSRHMAGQAEFMAAFGARLMALGRATDAVIRSGSDDVPLLALVEGTLAAHRGDLPRITVSGLAVTLRAPLVTMVGLALHELATNAMKYGSLSVPDGSVEIAWTVDGARKERRIELVWRERGGPPVAPPSYRGFGSQLLGRSMPRGVEVRMSFDPAGLECRMSLPLGAAEGDSRPA